MVYYWIWHPKKDGIGQDENIDKSGFFCDLSSKHGSGRDQALISLNDFQHSNATSLKTWNLGIQTQQIQHRFIANTNTIPFVHSNAIYSEQTQQGIQLGIWNHLCVFSVAESTLKTMEMHMLQFPRRSEKYIRNLFFIMEIPKGYKPQGEKNTRKTLR
jgi:hypothetical protein